MLMALPGAISKPPWLRAVNAPFNTLCSSFRCLSHLPPPPPPPFPVIKTCPSPTCSCAATPTGLDIDHQRPLSGTIPGYNQHVVICTGKDDWPRRIEDESTTGLFGRRRPFARYLKGQVGPKGDLHDVG